jgi:hypothetical protein
LPDGRELRQFTPDIGIATNLRFSPDGKALLASGTDKAVRVWDLATGKLIQQHEDPDANTPHGLYAPNGRILLLFARKDGYRLSSPGVPERHWLRGPSDEPVAAAVSPDGKLLATAGREAVRIWSIDSGELRAACKGHRDTVTSVQFAPDGRRLVSASRDRTICVWDPATGRRLLTLDGTRDGLDAHAASLAFSPDGTVLAAGCADGRVILYTGGPTTVLGPKKTTPEESKARPHLFRCPAESLTWPQVFDWLTAQTGLPVITKEKPAGTFGIGDPKGGAFYTLREIIDLLNETLQPHQLMLVRGEASFGVYSIKDFKEERKRFMRIPLESLGEYGDTEPVYVRVPLVNLDVKDIEPEVRKLLGPLGSIATIPASNTLMVQDVAGNVRRIVQVLQDVDQPKEKK